MADYNLVVIAGKLMENPKSGHSDENLPYVTFPVSVHCQEVRPDGTVEKSVTFVNVIAWADQAVICAKFLKKGASVLVSGRLEQEEVSRKYRVKAARVQFLDPAPKESKRG